MVEVMNATQMEIFIRVIFNKARLMVKVIIHGFNLVKSMMVNGLKALDMARVFGNETTKILQQISKTLMLVCGVMAKLMVLVFIPGTMGINTRVNGKLA